jgi:hypothetical protein
MVRQGANGSGKSAGAKTQRGADKTERGRVRRAGEAAAARRARR